MATTFQELQTKHDEVAKLVEGDPVQSGQVGRVKRNMEVFTELEKIKQAAGADKEKYMKDVVAEAKTLVEANKDALLKLSELRKDSVANASEIAKLFSDNKDLIKARAYLVLGVGLSSVKPDSEEAKFFAQFLVDGKDADFSTNSLIEKVKLSAADAQKTADQLHEDCLNAAADEISRVLEYLKSVKDKASKVNDEEIKDSGRKLQASDKIIADTFGVEIDEKGAVTKIVDAEKAKLLSSKALGDIQLGDILVDITEEREKGASSARTALGSDKEKFAGLLKALSGFYRATVEVKRVTPTSSGSEAKSAYVLVDLVTKTNVTTAKVNEPKAPQCALFGFEQTKNQARRESGADVHIGVKIGKVTKGSALEKAGVVDGDIITHFNGEEVKTRTELFKALEATEVNKDYTCEFISGSSDKAFRAVINSKASRDKTLGLGITFEQHATWNGHEFNAVHLVSVPEGSAGWQIGLKSDMVISSIDGKVVKSHSTFSSLLSEALKSGKPFTIGLMEKYGDVSEISVNPEGVNFYGFIDEDKSAK